MVKARGRGDQAAQAEGELPDQVDTQNDGGLLAKFDIGRAQLAPLQPFGVTIRSQALLGWGLSDPRCRAAIRRHRARRGSTRTWLREAAVVGGEERDWSTAGRQLIPPALGAPRAAASWKAWEVTDVAGVVSPVLGGLIRELDRAAPSDLVEVCRTWVVRNLGVQECVLLLADYSETSLEPVPGAEGTTEMPRLDVDGSEAGRAYRQQRAVHATVPTHGEAAPESTVTYLPVSMRTERLGVLAVTRRATNEVEQLDILDDVAQILAYVLTGARRYTDQFETLRRRRDLGLAAEIQWELLPVLAYELPRFSIAGALEPAYDIGGDTFDYAVSAQQLTVSITDAVGHGLRAAMLSSLTVSAMRNARRSGASILDQAHTANRHLTDQFTHAEFVTGLILQLEVATGRGSIINAGHPPPLLLREGAVTIVNQFADLPLGLSPDTRYRLQPIELLPGDRLLLLTDGIDEAHDVGGPEFGLDRVADLLRSQAGLPPVEFVRRLTRAVADYRTGPLADDATAVCLDWYPRETP